MVSATVWILSAVAALGFLMAGMMKTLAFDKLVEQAPSMANVGQEKSRLIGIAELLGAVGLLMPIALDIVPLLSGFAALGLAIVGFSALGAHIKWGEGAKGAFPAVLGGICAVLAYIHFT